METPEKSKSKKRALTYDAICKRSNELRIAIDVQEKHIAGVISHIFTPHRIAATLSSYVVDSLAEKVKQGVRRVRQLRLLIQRYIITHLT